MPEKELYRGSAFSASVFAVLAGLAFLLSTGAVQEAARLRSAASEDQIQAFQSWNKLQALRVQDSLLQAQRQTLIALDRPPAPALDQDIERNHKEQDEVSREARQHEESLRRTQDRSARVARRSQRFAVAAGLFLIAVAVVSLAALDRARSLQSVAIVLAAAATVVLLDGFVLLF